MATQSPGKRKNLVEKNHPLKWRLLRRPKAAPRNDISCVLGTPGFLIYIRGYFGVLLVKLIYQFIHGGET
jgi:hypothetical protein